ncbi:MAG TPA: class I SAM-dependent rRNA methyltransferase [Rhizomicrobium sp.]|nr:class I SAM-dependent rRNA methyltransferase [Rhizomicrobium sp.]
MSVHPVVKLKPREGRRARAGAPWVFANELVLDAATRALKPGTLVRVLAGDKDGRDFGLGYFNPKSLIAIRLFETGGAVGTAFFAGRLRRALSLRQMLYDAPFYRLVHAEGDGLPGLSIDRFGEICVVQVTTAGMEALLDEALAALDEVVAPRTVILRNDTASRALEGLEPYVRAARGEAGRIEIRENGAGHFAEPMSGQKTGWYYDQRDNRAFMARLTAGRSVLDICCYTGGFAIAAARAGAANVTAIDSSEPALALAEAAAKANGVSIRLVRADMFEELARMAARGEKFDIVIADPPPFVKSRKDLEAGARAYRKLARLAAQVTAPGGFLLLASCSHNIAMERFAQECAGGLARAQRHGALIRQAGAGPDHPVHPMLPETAYLKALVYRLG